MNGYISYYCCRIMNRQINNRLVQINLPFGSIPELCLGTVSVLFCVVLSSRKAGMTTLMMRMVDDKYNSSNNNKRNSTEG